MRTNGRSFLASILSFILCFTALSSAQQSTPSGGATSEAKPELSVAAVPRLFPYTGTVRDVGGRPLTGMQSLNFALYQDQDGGAPLWMELQNVQLDDQGRYTVVLGVVSGGLPSDLFSSSTPHWLGVQAQIGGEPEQARVLLISVPFALKAGDAETIGGKPASAFVLANPAPESSDSDKSINLGATTGTKGKIGTANITRTNTSIVDGTVTTNTVVKFGNAADGILANSDIVNVNGLVGIGIGTPGAILDVRNTASPNTTPIDIHQVNGNPYAMRFFNDMYGGSAGATFFVTDTGDGNVGSGGPTKFNLLTNGAVRWSINPSGHLLAGVDNTVDIGASGASRPRNLYIANNGVFGGNVGIGTSNPATKLDVAGQLRVSDIIVSGGSISLPNSAGIGSGVLTLGGSPFLHNYGTNTTALGTNAGTFSLNGGDNTAVGAYAATNTVGSWTTAVGSNALRNNTTGSENTAIGYQALYNDTQGGGNTALGGLALSANTMGGGNTAAGAEALSGNLTGHTNTAVGIQALYNNISGYQNTAVGAAAGFPSNQDNANKTGWNNTFLGFQSGPGTNVEINNATAIGANALVAADNTLVLGAPSVSVAIGAPTAATKLQVVGDIRVGTSGTNGCIQGFGGAAVAGTCSSDVRLKQNIEPFLPVLDNLIQLQPVSYEWNAAEHPEYHFGSERTSGLIAQEVEKVFPNMVATDERGYKAVNYSQLPLLLLQAMRELKAESDNRAAQLTQQQQLIGQLFLEVEQLKARLNVGPNPK